MAFKVRFAPQAQEDIRDFATYLAAYSEDIADRYISELAAAIERHILPRPMSWQFFFLTGAPYRAYLFKISRRTAYWIIFEIDEHPQTVNILRFWHAARDPEAFVV
jgi:plasmid stabilization system protein ParE